MGAGPGQPRGLRADFGTDWTDEDARLQELHSERVRPGPPRELPEGELEEVRRLNDERQEALDAAEDELLPDFAEQLLADMAERRGARSPEELLDLLKVEDVMEEWPEGEAPWHLDPLRPR